MRTKRFLALLLALLMMVSLLPAAALAEDVEDEAPVEGAAPAENAPETEANEDPAPLPEEAEEAEIEALIPEEDLAEPEADPVAYDLWVCGVQVTSANKQSIDGSYMVRFDPDTNTLTIYTNTFFKNHSTELHEGALIYSALPNLTIDLQLNTDSVSKYISSDAAQTLVYVENGSLTIVTKEGTKPQLKSNSAKVGIDVHGGSFNLSGNLYMYSKSEQIGLNVPDGTVTLNGDLDVSLKGDTADCGIYAEKGLTSTGTLYADTYDCKGGFGIKVMNGPITINGGAGVTAYHCGIYCGNGDVNITGETSFGCYNGGPDTLCPSSGLYVANGNVTIGAFYMFGGAEWTVYASGSVHVTEDLEFENTANLLGGNGIKSEHGGIVLDGNATITAINCLDSGDSTEGILVKGNLTLKPSGRHGAKADNGPITVQGNLDVRGAREIAVVAKGDITVEGNAYVAANNYGYSTSSGIPMECTEGSITVAGDLSCLGNKNPCYAKNDIQVGGNALFSGSGDYGVKAENGKITVGGTLTAKGNTAYSVWVGTNVTVDKDVTVTNAAEGSVGMYAEGAINFVSGKWDVTSGAAALQAGTGIVIPEGYGVTLPGRGIVAVVGGLNTVTEYDGTTVAAHAIIEAKNYTDGYYLIGPDWTLTGVIPTDKFEVNPDNESEFILNTTLAVGDQIKVVQLTDGAITAWYPDGYGTEYTVDQAHAGNVSIRFKTTYDAEWSEFGGFMYIVHVHNWSKPTWNWAEDYLSATATFVCAGDPSHTVTLDAVVTVQKDSDCEWGTFVDYIAVVEFEGQTYKGYKSFDYPDGHPWGEPTWEWAEDYSSATATFVCENDASHTKTVTATVTSEVVGNEKVYTATVELDGETYTETKSVSIGVTVTLDAGEGTVDPATVEINAGEAIGELPVPTREGGWVFMGWYPEPAPSLLKICQGTAVTAETTFDEDTIVYAHWRLPGDVNGDGKVNTADVALLAKYVKARGQGVEIVPGSGDVNGDGKVNTADVALLAKYVKARGKDVVIH